MKLNFSATLWGAVILFQMLLTKCAFMNRKNSCNFILAPYLETKLYWNSRQVSNIYTHFKKSLTILILQGSQDYQSKKKTWLSYVIQLDFTWDYFTELKFQWYYSRVKIRDNSLEDLGFFQYKTLSHLKRTQNKKLIWFPPLILTEKNHSFLSSDSH